MSKNEKIYEPPKMKAYQFDESDQVLTASNGGNDDKKDDTEKVADYAASALNDLMGGTNTTIE